MTENSDSARRSEHVDSARRSEHWILLRGLAREARHWGDFPEQLRAELASAGIDAKIDTIDLPGAGRFSEMKTPPSIPEITEFVRGKFTEIRNAMRESGETPPSATRLLAVSLGGMVASNWLSRWPADFSGCVLINTSFRGFSPIFQRLNPRSIKTLLGIVRTGDVRQRESKIIRLISNRDDLVEATAEEWARIAEDRPVSVENFSRQLLAAARYLPTRDIPDAPVLILGSLKDRMVDQDCSKRIAVHWETDYETHPSAGHDLTLDDPAWTVEKIVEWDSRLKESAP